MTVNEIIKELYCSNDLDDCIRKTVRHDHRQDFKQELFLLLYEKPHELLISLYNTSGLTYYVVKIVLNLVNQKRNVYHKKYNDQNITYDSDKLVHISKEDVCITERMQKEQHEAMLINEINNGLDETFGNPYYRLLVYMVKDHGSMREVSRQTGIPVSSISESIKKVRNHLNKIYNDPQTIEGVY